MSLDARSIERRLSKMESAIARVNARPIAPVRFGSGGGGGTDVTPETLFETVAVLPAIPTTGWKIVIWGSSTLIEGGTGDDQPWFAAQGFTEWSAMANCTSNSGAVV